MGTYLEDWRIASDVIIVNSALISACLQDKATYENPIILEKECREGAAEGGVREGLAAEGKQSGGYQWREAKGR